MEEKELFHRIELFIRLFRRRISRNFLVCAPVSTLTLSVPKNVFPMCQTQLRMDENNLLCVFLGDFLCFSALLSI